MKIGELRRRLFVDYDCKWNGLVREVTANCERGDEQVNEYQVVKFLLDHLTALCRLDITFPHENGQRAWKLFEESK